MVVRVTVAAADAGARTSSRAAAPTTPAIRLQLGERRDGATPNIGMTSVCDELGSSGIPIPMASLLLRGSTRHSRNCPRHRMRQAFNLGRRNHLCEASDQTDFPALLVGVALGAKPQVHVGSEIKSWSGRRGTSLQVPSVRSSSLIEICRSEISICLSPANDESLGRDRQLTLH